VQSVDTRWRCFSHLLNPYTQWLLTRALHYLQRVELSFSTAHHLKQVSSAGIVYLRNIITLPVSTGLKIGLEFEVEQLLKYRLID